MPPHPLTRPVARCGHAVLGLIEEMGAMALFAARGARHIPSRGQAAKVLRQICFIGAGSSFL
ncbi:MAG: hypothetical protein LBP61_02025, partial [Desulfovibrio sp.]|nr:hypothetical protein [Desulfovibrio sp.]